MVKKHLLAKWLKALADARRLKIVELLGRRSICVCELEGLLGLTQPAVSHHLRVLKEAGIITDTRRGKWVYYSLNRNHYSALLDAMAMLPAEDSGDDPDICRAVGSQHRAEPIGSDEGGKDR